MDTVGPVGVDIPNYSNRPPGPAVTASFPAIIGRLAVPATPDECATQDGVEESLAQ